MGMNLTRIIGLICLGLIIAVPISAQDFEQLLKAVDKLEASLQERLDQESRQRQQEVEQLRTEIADVKQEPQDSRQFDEIREQLAAIQASQSNSVDTAWRNQMERRIEGLSEQIAALATQQTQPAAGITDEDLAVILSDIAWLKAENTRLNELLEGGSQFVSTDAMAIPPAERQRVEDLTERLTVLNEQLERVIDRDKAQTDPASVPGPFDGLSIGGFIDASNFSDFNTSENSFGLDQVEVDIGHDFSSRAQVQADIEYVSDGQGGFNLDLEQGYFTYAVGSHEQWQFQFGKFNAPIGFESVDPPDMYQYSGGLVGSYCLPTNLTGLLVRTQVGSSVQWAAYAVNGWDVNTDNNQDKTLGTRLGVNPFTNLGLGLSTISGPERDNNNSSRRTVIDLDLTYVVTESWLWGGDFNYGTETNVLADGGDADWTGFLVMTNIGFAERWAVTGRFDYLNDRHGVLTGLRQEWKAVTVSPSVTLTDALGGLVEFRYDFSDKPAFAGNDGVEDNLFTTAVEFIYTF